MRAVKSPLPTVSVTMESYVEVQMLIAPHIQFVKHILYVAINCFVSVAIFGSGFSARFRNV